MRVRLPHAEQWTPDFQRQLNGELERALERLNEYALVPYGGAHGDVLTRDTERPFVMKWAPGGSGSGAFYTGVNLGSGARVYKETDTTTNPREHKFRSLVAGSNVSITEEADEIVIAAAAGGGGGGGGGVIGRPRSQYVGSFPERCGTRTTSIRMADDVPAAQAGDLVVWIVYFTYQAGTTSMPSTSGRVRFPSGWKLLSYEFTGGFRAPFIAYKFLTAADLTTTFTADTVLTPIRTMCSHGYVYRDVHRNRPFGTPATMGEAMQQSAALLGNVLLYDDQLMMQVLSRRGGSLQPATPRPWSTQLGPTEFDGLTEAFILDGGTDVGSMFVNSWSWDASIKQDENWFGGETIYSTFGSGWTFQFMTYSQTPFTPSATLGASATTTRHYCERTVELVAGQKYTFCVLTGSGVALSVIDPSTNERCYGARDLSGSTNSIDGYLVNDPLADHGTTWQGGHWSLNQDGVPGTPGGWVFLLFTAQETGTHTLRVSNVDDGITAGDLSSLTFLGGGSTRVNHVGFRRGWHAPAKIYTPAGPVMAGDINSAYTTQAACVSYCSLTYTEVAGGNSGSIALAIPINPPWDEFPPARASDCYYTPPGIATDLDGRGLKFRTDSYLGNDGRRGVMVQSMIYPDIDGIAQKYYFEVTADSASGSDTMSVQLCTPGNFQSAQKGQNEYSYSWDTTVGEVLGCLVDYVNGQVVWSKDGTVVRTDAMPTTTYPASGTALREQPLYLALGPGIDAHMHDFELNLAGPFAYPPASDVLPYDHDSNPLLAVGDGLVQNTGDGLQIGSNGQNGEILLKSLTQGAGITLTDSADEIDIALDTEFLTDYLSTKIAAGTGIAINFDDASNTLTVSATGSVAPTNNIDDEVAADSPRAYWKFDEASGAFADSSGNGYTLTTNGSPVAAYQFANYDPVNTTRKGALLTFSSANYLSRADTLGMTMPQTSWSIEFWGALTPTNIAGVFTISANGETLATNQIMVMSFTAAGVPTLLWEYGAGTNSPTLNSQSGALDGNFAHWVVTKNAASTTVMFYKNGRPIGVGTYTGAQEATGGTSATTWIGRDAGTTPAPPGVFCGLAVYDTVLSSARVYAHAQALGFK